MPDLGQKPIEIKLKETVAEESEAPRSHNSKKGILIGVIVILAAIFLVGLRWVFSVAPSDAPFLLFSYAVGLTMIFLPCTLPLAFVIVPLSMGKAPTKGIGMALAFSLGVTITLSIYGALIGSLGNALGIGRVETAKNILYALAGIFGIAIALGELGLIKFKMPMYSGGGPAFIQKQGDYLKAMMLGLFLGNIGVGCPNPLFNAVILPAIVVKASALQGFWIMFIHALGRITPLLLLAFLAILGVNATGFLVRHKDRVGKGTAWAMVFVGGFLFMIGAFGHDGYSYSGIHSFLEKITQEEYITNILGEKIKTLGHGHDIPSGPYLPYAPWAMVLLWLVPMWCWYFSEKSKLYEMSLEDEKKRRPELRAKKWFLVVTSAFLIVVFGWALPHQFLYHSSHEESPPARVDIKATSPLEAGKRINFEISIKDVVGADLKDVLEYSHERLIHVIVIHENLKLFAHIHPEDEAVLTTKMFAEGKFPFKIKLPKEGRYVVAVNFVARGHEVGFTKTFDVGERSEEFQKDFSTKKKFDGYDVSFKADKNEIVSGEDTDFTYHFEKDGKPVTNLGPYLGAPMHFAIVSADLSSFSHTHGVLEAGHEDAMDHSGWNMLPIVSAHEGEEEDSRGGDAALPKAFGPNIYLHYTFPHPGLYAIFGEAKHNGKVVLTKFMVEVSAGTGGAMTEEAHGH